MTAEVNYREAIALALGAELEADPKVVLIGEDVGEAGGVFKSTAGLYDRFGGSRVRDTPISEQAIVGAALGAAIMGLRPVAEIMFADFAGVCFDQIANQLAKYRYMTGGQARVPVTLRLANGAGAGFAAQHSQAVENWFLNIPGLKIAVPATPADAYGLLRSAIREDNPVLVFEHKNLFGVKGPLPDGDGLVPLGVADVARRGNDVTIVATQQMRHRALEAAERLQDRHIEAEVIDPRTLVPFDDRTVIESLTRTARLVVVQEASVDGSWGASLIARIVTESWSLLDAPPALVAADPTPIAFASELEALWLPSAGKIAEAVERTVSY